jgi:hypothetical protein
LDDRGHYIGGPPLRQGQKKHQQISQFPDIVWVLSRVTDQDHPRLENSAGWASGVRDHWSGDIHDVVDHQIGVLVRWQPEHLLDLGEVALAVTEVNGGISLMRVHILRIADRPRGEMRQIVVLELDTG